MGGVIVTGVSWDRQVCRLALCTGSNKLYVWSPDGGLCVDVPTEGDTDIHCLFPLYCNVHLPMAIFWFGVHWCRAGPVSRFSASCCPLQPVVTTLLKIIGL